MEPIANPQDLQTKRATGEGYIYNDFSGHGSTGDRYNVLHMASCDALARMGTVPPRKFFSLDLNAAVDWLNANRGPEGQNWKRCDAQNSHCFA